jgi:hypothetical protein
MAVAPEQAVRLVQVAAPEERRQLVLLVAQVVFHRRLEERLVAPEKMVRPVISSVLRRITAEAELAVLMAAQRRHQLRLATMQAPQVA